MARPLRHFLISLAAGLTLVAASVPAAPAKEPKAGKSIVFGAQANPVDFSFTVAVLQDGRFNCTGSVVAPTLVLTAGHCVGNPAGLTVITGRSKIGDAGGEVISVTGASVHPDFIANQRHDVALLTLAVPTTVTPIKVATPAEEAATFVRGQGLSIAGYGKTNPLVFGRPRTGVLTTAPSFVAPQRPCGQVFKRGLFDPATMVCMVANSVRRRGIGRFVGFSACPGDSGGPLAVRLGDGTPALFGVVSFIPGRGRGPFRAIDCGLLGVTILTRISSVLDFLLPAGVPPRT